MGHVVHYRSAAGESRLEDVSSLQEAVERIEHLRNEEGVEDVRLFREVPLKVRTYYRVSVEDVAEPAEGAVEPSAPAEAPGTEPPPGAMNLSPPPAAAVATPAAADEEPRRTSLFGRG